VIIYYYCCYLCILHKVELFAVAECISSSAVVQAPTLVMVEAPLVDNEVISSINIPCQSSWEQTEFLELLLYFSAIGPSRYSCYCFVSIVCLHLEIRAFYFLAFFIYLLYCCWKLPSLNALLYYCSVESENHAKDVVEFSLKTCLKFTHTKILAQTCRCTVYKCVTI